MIDETEAPFATDHLEAGRMTIWEHLAELRGRLVKVSIAIVLGMCFGFWVYPYLLTFLLHPLCDLVGTDKCVLIATDPLDPFATRIKISAYVGIMCAMPVILWQIWRFVTPGLYPHEKRYAVPFVASALLLFAFGAAIAYYTLNPALQFLISIGGTDVEPFYTPDNYVTLIAYMMVAFGVGFEFPVLLVALQIAGVLTPKKLLSWWRQAVVIIVVFAAVATPSADPISMMALALPMIMFYGMAIAIGYLLQKLKRNKQAADAVAGG
jgi:sec-independent protein translocase protein TatC